MPSIQRRGDRSFLLVVEAGYKADGSRKKVTKTLKIEDDKLLKTKRKLQEYLNDQLLIFKQTVESGEYIKPSKDSFELFARNEWMPKYMKKSMSPLTAQNYTHHLEHDLFPVFGHVPLHEISTMLIVTFFDDLDKTKLSGSTKLYIYKVLKSVFNQAVKWNVLTRNPVVGAERPKVEKKQAKYYDAIDAQKVIAALQSEPPRWKIFFMASMLGGFRRGELVALEWDSVDFEAGTIWVRKSISASQDGKPFEKAPKTEGSHREVDMPEWFMNELRRFRFSWLEEKMKIGDKWLGGDKQYVFHGENGNPVYHNTPSMKWRRFLEAHSLPKAPLHSLRHTAATLLIETETDLKSVQERLGHTKYSTTADLYAHVTKKVKKETASKLDKFDPGLNLRQQSVNNSLK
ncbi:MAG: site-specific integrase [Gorillibacterium sp.]|nr:site-specific integrase [Gorillibacterium sp.]